MQKFTSLVIINLMAYLAFHSISYAEKSPLCDGCTIATPPEDSHTEVRCFKLHTKNLCFLIDSGIKITIVDARAEEYDDKIRIPHAKRLPFNASAKQIQKVIPSKSSVVVVYCTHSECPASRWLAERLIKMGYENVYKYVEGIEAWEIAGYPVEEDNS